MGLGFTENRALGAFNIKQKQRLPTITTIGSLHLTLILMKLKHPSSYSIYLAFFIQLHDHSNPWNCQRPPSLIQTSIAKGTEEKEFFTSLAFDRNSLPQYPKRPKYSLSIPLLIKSSGVIKSLTLVSQRPAMRRIPLSA